MTECVVVPVLCQKAGTRKPVLIDYTRKLESRWVAGEVRGIGESFRPTRPTGFQYTTLTAGQAGSREPIWRNPETAGNTYQDGSLTLIAEAISNTSLSNTIQSSAWVGPSDLTIDGDGMQATGGEQKAFAFVEGDTPGKYRIRNDVVYALNGETDSQEIDIEIE